MPSPRDPIRKPLLGFGRTGWVLLAIAIPLAICFFTGYDLRFQILRLIHSTLGFDAVGLLLSIFFGHDLNLLGSWPTWADFGLITMSVMLIAMRIHPRRFGAVRYAAVIAWGLLCPGMMFILVRLQNWLGLQSGEYDARDPVFRDAIRFTLTVILFAWVTRSWCLTLLVTLFHAAFWIGGRDYQVTLAATPARSPWITGSDFVFSRWFLWSWHVATYAGLLFWAIRARLKLPKPGHCIHCNYHLHGIATPACPECGRAVSTTNTTTPAAVSPSASTPPSSSPSP